MKSSTIKAVILCAGSGSRTGLSYNKVLHYFGAKTAVEYCIDAFHAADITDITLVAAQRDKDRLRALVTDPSVKICDGGETRFQSVKNALETLDDCDIVVIHDGARPFVTPETIKDSVISAQKFGSGIAAVPALDTVKIAEDGIITSHLKRKNTFLIQTPQAFDYGLISRAYSKARGEFTDDSEVFQITGKNIHLSHGEYANIKITRPEDLFALPRGVFAGIGFDLHTAEFGNEITLGGIKIPCDMRLVGHSDADVLIHAIMDALLSAEELPDIGVLFPDTDDAYLNIDSTVLLTKVLSLMKKEISSISCVIIAQKPKLASYIPLMREKLASVLNISREKINISATTTEHLGLIGDGKAIAASAMTLLKD